MTTDKKTLSKANFDFEKSASDYDQLRRLEPLCYIDTILGSIKNGEVMKMETGSVRASWITLMIPCAISVILPSFP